MNLAAQYQIISVDQRIDKSLKNASFAVIRHFNAGVSGFLPAGFHIPLDKADTLIEQDNQAAGIFRAIKRIHHAAAFIKAVPACAEQAGMPDGRIICEQSTCVGQLAVFVPHIKGIEQLFFHAVSCPRLISLPQLGKSVILKIILGNQLVIGAVHPLENKLVQHIGRGNHAFIANADICLHNTVRFVVIRCGAPC